jgi:hypothetical protein
MEMDDDLEHGKRLTLDGLRRGFGFAKKTFSGQGIDTMSRRAE